MGWWDSLWPSSAEDPLRKLDPKLREFLEKESPVKYSTGTTTTATDHQQQPPSHTKTTPPTTKPQTSSSSSTQENGGSSVAAATAEAAVPKESQFQDGRYAHLWRTYRPLAEVEAETKSEHEKLMDVLEGYKDRKSQIGRAALENCALEQVDWRGCMSNPSMAERMTMCRTQVRKSERCYMMQTRFLKALGYLSTLDRSPEVEEEIQLHADTLYHRMLAQEAEVEKAKAEGRPLPKFGPLLPAAPQQQQQQEQQQLPATAIIQPQKQEPELTPEQQEVLRTRLEKVPEEDRLAEEAAIRGEWRAKAELAARVQDLWKQQEQDRLVRKEKGEQTTWDRLAGAFKTNSSSSSGTGTGTSTSSTGEAGKK